MAPTVNAMVDPMFDPALLHPERARPLLRREYEQLIELGAFGDEHVELLRGVLVKMSPQGEPHARISGWLAHRLARALEIARYDVRSHSPFAASNDSMPEPDVSVARRTPKGSHPSTALLLIEVTGSSVTKDRLIKTEIYAKAGVPEYWIVDLRSDTVDVLTHPGRDGYAKTTRFSNGDVLRPRRLRGIAITVSSIPWLPRDPSSKRKPRRRPRKRAS